MKQNKTAREIEIKIVILAILPPNPVLTFGGDGVGGWVDLFFFFLTYIPVLLRYHIHEIKFTHLKYGEWFFSIF